MRARRLLSSAALAVLATGCAAGAPRPQTELPDELRRLVALLVLRRDEIADLRTRAEVTLRHGASTRRFAGALLIRTPDAVRFEALSPFGPPFLLLTMADGTLTTYSVADHRALVGPATRATTGRWLGVPLDPEDLVGLLLGRVIPPRDLREAEILPADLHGRSVRLVGAAQTRRVWMDFETGAITRAEIGGGRRTLTVAYDRADVDGVPRALHVATDGGDLEGDVRYREPAVSVGIDPTLFHFEIPEGANVQRFH